MHEIKLFFLFLIVREECGIEASKWELKEARIQRITEENMDQYTLNDVVMPIPGHKVSYPGKVFILTRFVFVHLLRFLCSSLVFRSVQITSLCLYCQFS